MKRFVIAGRYVAAVAEQFLDVMERGEVETGCPASGTLKWQRRWKLPVFRAVNFRRK